MIKSGVDEKTGEYFITVDISAMLANITDKNDMRQALATIRGAISISGEECEATLMQGFMKKTQSKILTPGAMPPPNLTVH